MDIERLNISYMEYIALYRYIYYSFWYMLYNVDMLYKDSNWLKEQYWGNDLTMERIGELCNVSRVTIKNWMVRYNIPVRPRYYHLVLLNQDSAHQSNAGKGRAAWTNSHYSDKARERMLNNNIARLMHIRFKERDPEGYSKSQRLKGVKGGLVMRERFKNGFSPLKVWKENDPEGFKDHQIDAGHKRGLQLFDKDFYETHGIMKSNFPYPDEFNKELKRHVFLRDSGICQVCNTTVNGNHSVHHIDYNIFNCAMDNLILLCRSCHSKTNFNREYWMQYFFNKL